jgi:hypothetical protein
LKTKEILHVWKSFLKKDIISEISIKRFQEQNPEFDTTNFTTQLKGNTDYLDIINNSIASGQQHSPDDYLQQFEFYKNSIEPNRNSQEFLTINVPGENDPVSLANKVTQGSCTATFDDIQQFQQARMFVQGKGSKNKLTAAYIKVLEEASQNDFEIIVNNNDWIVYYPKSIRGSIALTRSYWDGSKIVYDNTFNPSIGYGQKTGHMNWCTSVSGSGNMFINYHIRLNLHMYYCIKKRVLDVSDETRKICVSYTKTGNTVKMTHDSGSTVNANNKAIDKNDVIGCLGSTVVGVLYKDVMLPKRKEIDLNSYYKSISLEQYITMRKANEENIIDFVNEFRSIIKLSKDKEKIKKYSINDNSEHIISEIIKYANSEEEITFFYNKWKTSKVVKRALSLFKASILPEPIFEEMLNDSDEITANPLKRIKYKRISLPQLKSIAKGGSLSDKSVILSDKNLSLEIINILLNDENEDIRKEASEHPTKIKHDLSTNDLSYLRQKPRWYKRTLLNNDDLLTPEVLEVLAFDENIDVASSAIHHDNCPIHILQDPKLLNHENYSIRQAIAMNNKTPTNIIHYLSKDDHFRVSDMAKRHVNFRPELNQENKLIKDYIKLFLS